MKTKTNILLILCITFSIHVFCQTDTLRAKSRDSIPDEYKYTCIRFGVGCQKALFTEIGISRLLIIDELPNKGGSLCFYSSFEWMPDINNKPENSIYGIKVGCEATAIIPGFGLELSYFTNSYNDDIVFTPRVGLSIFGLANMFYGYNISANDYPFKGFGKHNISLVINLSKKIIDEIKKESK